MAKYTVFVASEYLAQGETHIAVGIRGTDDQYTLMANGGIAAEYATSADFVARFGHMPPLVGSTLVLQQEYPVTAYELV